MGSAASSSARPDAAQNSGSSRKRTAAWREDNRLSGPWTFRMKENVQCLCEGAAFCTRENPAKQRTTAAVTGLHADWVGDQVLAMARPWQANVLRYNIVEHFLKLNIGMILNLQEVGEHANCGPGNLKGGFTYDAESFMAARIGVYCFGWRDMGVPNLDRMMDIVQVMDYVVSTEGRKVAVHCHAGLGRTGVAIACFLVYSRRCNASDAVVAVRRDRPGALQTDSQVLFVSIFEQLLGHLRCVIRASGTQAVAVSQSRPSGGQEISAAPYNPAAATPARALGADGKPLFTDQPESVTEAAGMRTEKYSSGLIIVKPLSIINAAKDASATSGPPSPAAAATPPPVPTRQSEEELLISEHELGLQRGLPWTENFSILKDEYRQDLVPQPPHTYYEALRRQQRLFHGTERRALLHLHRLVKESVLVIIEAARAFTPEPPRVAARAAAPVAVRPPPSASPPPPRASPLGPPPDGATQAAAPPAPPPLRMAKAGAPAAAKPKSGAAPAGAKASPPKVAAGAAAAPKSRPSPPRPASAARSGKSPNRRPPPAPLPPPPSPPAAPLPPPPGPLPALPPINGQRPAPSNGSKAKLGMPPSFNPSPAGSPGPASPSPGSPAPSAPPSANGSPPAAAASPAPARKSAKSGGGAKAAVSPLGAKPAGASVAPPAAAVPLFTFAHAVALSVSGEFKPLTDPVSGASAVPLRHTFFGPGWDTVRASEGQLRRAVNAYDYDALATAPLAAVFLLLGGFFQQFQGASLTEPGLAHIAAVYQSVPSMPTNEPDTKQFQDAWQTLKVLHVADQELLTSFASLLRHVLRASGPGCEEAMVTNTRWVARCLLGSGSVVLGDSPALESVMTFLYYLLMNDTGFATLVLFKQTRLQGKRVSEAPVDRSPDVMPGNRKESMMSVTSTEGGSPLAQPAVHYFTPGSSPVPSASGLLSSPSGAQQPLSGRTPPPSPGGALTSSQQVRELVGQDVGSPFAPLPSSPLSDAPPAPSPFPPIASRNRLAAIPTVVMPPQQQQGGVPVHDVWI